MTLTLKHGIDADGYFVGDFLYRTIEQRDDEGNVIASGETPDDPEGIAVCAAIISEHPASGLQCPQWNGATWTDAHMPWVSDPDTGMPVTTNDPEV